MPEKEKQNSAISDVMSALLQTPQKLPDLLQSYQQEVQQFMQNEPVKAATVIRNSGMPLKEACERAQIADNVRDQIVKALGERVDGEKGLDKEDRTANVNNLMQNGELLPSTADPVYQRARMSAVLEAGATPNEEQANAEKIFNVASVTKMFTAATVMRMVENDQAEEQSKPLFEKGLDTPLKRFLPDMKAKYIDQAGRDEDGMLKEGAIKERKSVSEFFNQLTTNPEYDNITVRDLLEHKSGLPEPTGQLIADIEANPDKQWQMTDYFQEKCLDCQKEGEVRKTEFGEADYNNLGYMLLGGIIEIVGSKAAGEDKTYEDMVNDLVINDNSLKLKNTFTKDKEVPDDRQLRGIMSQGKEEKIEDWVGPAGELRSTPSDMNRFTQAFFSEGKEGKAAPLFKTEEMRGQIKASGEKGFQEALKAKAKDNDYEYYPGGLGFELFLKEKAGQEEGYDKQYGKYGDGFAINTFAGYSPDSGRSASFVGVYDEQFASQVEEFKPANKNKEQFNETEISAFGGDARAAQEPSASPKPDVVKALRGSAMEVDASEREEKPIANAPQESKGAGIG